MYWYYLIKEPGKYFKCNIMRYGLTEAFNSQDLSRYVKRVTFPMDLSENPMRD